MNFFEELNSEEMKEIELDNFMVTLGTDIHRKFAWCLRKVNGVDSICIHKRVDGMSGFDEKDFITSIPLETIKRCSKIL